MFRLADNLLFSAHNSRAQQYMCVQMRWAETIYVTKKFPNFVRHCKFRTVFSPRVLCFVYLCLCFIFVTCISMTAVTHFYADISPWNLSIMPNWCHVIFIVDKVAMEQSPPPPSSFFSPPLHIIFALLLHSHYYCPLEQQ